MVCAGFQQGHPVSDFGREAMNQQTLNYRWTGSGRLWGLSSHTGQLTGLALGLAGAVSRDKGEVTAGLKTKAKDVARARFSV